MSEEKESPKDTLDPLLLIVETLEKEYQEKEEERKDAK